MGEVRTFTQREWDEREARFLLAKQELCEDTVNLQAALRRAQELHRSAEADLRDARGKLSDALAKAKASDVYAGKLERDLEVTRERLTEALCAGESMSKRIDEAVYDERRDAAKDAEILRCTLEFAALENYTAVLLDRLTNGRISKPMTELTAVESEVNEAFTAELSAELAAARERIAELQPLAEIGRLAVKKREAQIHKDNTPAGDLREVLLRRANLLDADADLDDATNAYLTTPAKQNTEDGR